MAITPRTSVRQGGHTDVPAGWTVNMPTDLAVNDFIVVLVSFDWNNTPTITPPTGFTFAASAVYSGNNRGNMYTKKADGSEGGSVSFGTSARADCTWTSIAYAGVDTTTPFDVAATGATNGPGGGATPTPPSQTTVTPGAMIVAGYTTIAVSSPQFVSSSPSATSRKDYAFGSHHLVLVDYVKATAGAVAIQATMNQAPIWNSMQLALRPAAATGQFARPSADVTDGLWTNESGNNTNLYASIDETTANDSDYIQSSLSPASADVSEVALSSLVDPISSSGHKVRYRYQKNATGGDQINLTVRLMQGATQIATWSHTNIDAITTAEQTLSGGEADSITDYSNLRLRFEAIKV